MENKHQGCVGLRPEFSCACEQRIEIGTGQANTAKILTVCKTAGIAADVAYKYSTTTTPNVPGAAGQWFLPSRKELDALCFEFFKGNPEEGTSQNSCRGNYPNQQAVTGDNQWNPVEF